MSFVAPERCEPNAGTAHRYKGHLARLWPHEFNQTVEKLAVALSVNNHDVFIRASKGEVKVPVDFLAFRVGGAGETDQADDYNFSHKKLYLAGVA